MMKYLSKNKKSLAIILMIVFLVFLNGGIVKGAEDCEEGLQVNWPKSPAQTELCGDSGIPTMVKYFYEWGIFLGGLAAFIALVLAGFQYMTSVGNPAKMQEARDRAVHATLGLVLLLSSFLILNTLNPELTKLQPPSTEIGGLVYQKWKGERTEEPCEWVALYHKKEYEGLFAIITPDGTKPSSSYWADKHPEDLRKLDECIKVAEEGLELWGWTPGWGTDWRIDINSVKMEGACQANFYEGEYCGGSFMSLGKSTPNIETSMSIGRIDSVKGLDVAPPYPPEVENLGVEQTDGEWKLKGRVTDLGKETVVKCFFDYGPVLDITDEGEAVVNFNKSIPESPIEKYGTGEFEATINKTELEDNESYQEYGCGWRPVCSNLAGTGIGETATFKIE